MITASGIARIRACPSSSVLARAEAYNEWAAMGTDEHEDLSSLADLPDELLALIPQGAQSEVKLGYDVATDVGRILGQGSGRDYGSPGPFEIVGSCDVLGTAGDMVVVVDWKTGFSDVEPAATNDQLWFYALAACRALGFDSATIRIVYTKTNRVDEHIIGPLELAEYAEKLKHLHCQVAERMAAKKRGEILDTKEGSWCKHCPSKAVCPAKNALLVQFSAGGLAVVGDSELSSDRARQAYEQVVRIEQLVKDAKKRLDVYVTENGPIDLGEGRAYGRYARKGNEKLDGSVTVQAIREIVGENAKEFESIAIERKTSKAAIERAAKQLGTPRIKNAVIKRIRELGGAVSTTEYPIGEYSVDKHEAAPAIDVEEVNNLLRLVP